MNYQEMVKTAQKAGKTTEKQMWQSIESVSDLLCDIKDAHPDLYWRFLREQYGIMNNCHYADKEFAEYDVSQIVYTDKEGKKRTGAYWTPEQVEEATKTMTFPSGTTKWDVFVAMNSFHADTCKVLADEQILKAAYQFYFADEDFPTNTKIWRYMAMVHSL